RENAFLDDAEVLVLELLAAGRLGSEQRPARVDEIRAREVKLLVDQEVLLLGTRVRNDLRRVLVAEDLQDALRLHVERLSGTEDRRLLVEGLARPRHERGRDAERGAVDDVGRARHVPGRVAARLGGAADAAAREAGGVGLALRQRFSGELAERAAVAVG